MGFQFFFLILIFSTGFYCVSCVHVVLNDCVFIFTIVIIIIVVFNIVIDYFFLDVIQGRRGHNCNVIQLLTVVINSMINDAGELFIMIKRLLVYE